MSENSEDESDSAVDYNKALKASKELSFPIIIYLACWMIPPTARAEAAQEQENYSGPNFCQIFIVEQITRSIACGHSMCDYCVRRINICLFCRTEFHGSVRVFLQF